MKYIYNKITWKNVRLRTKTYQLLNKVTRYICPVDKSDNLWTYPTYGKPRQIRPENYRIVTYQYLLELSETRYIIPRETGKPPLENSKTRTYPYLLKLPQTRYITP